MTIYGRGVRPLPVTALRAGDAGGAQSNSYREGEDVTIRWGYRKAPGAPLSGAGYTPAGQAFPTREPSDGTVQLRVLSQEVTTRLYLTDNDDGIDLGAIFGSWSVEAPGSLLSSTTEVEGSDTMDVGNGAVERTGWVTPIGVPGLGAWVDNGHTFVIDLTAVSGFGINFAARLVQINSDGTVLKQTGNPSPDIATFTSNLTLPGVYTLYIPSTTWTSVDPTDRFVLVLFAQAAFTGAGFHITWRTGTGTSYLDTSILGVMEGGVVREWSLPLDQTAEQLYPWTEIEADLNPMIGASGKTYNLWDDPPSPAPVLGGTAADAEDFDGTMKAGTETPGTMLASVTSATAERQVFITEAGEPGWGTGEWPIESIKVVLNITGITGSNLTLFCRAVRLSSSNVTKGAIASYPVSLTVDLVVAGDGVYTFYCPTPTGGWEAQGGAIDTSDRLAITLNYVHTGAGTATAEIVTGDGTSYVETPDVGISSDFTIEASVLKGSQQSSLATILVSGVA